MKRHMLWVILVLIAALLLMTGLAGATATRIEFTGTETCTQTSAGEVTFPDGNIHIRGMTEECQGVGSIPQVTGTDYVVVNLNLDSSGSGRAWGTFRLETAEGGVWEGIWEGTVTPTSSSLRAVGHGHGLYEGQQVFTTLESGAFSGYILDPHGP
jgi:hypothetical protein